jgi:hypothetical protein
MSSQTPVPSSAITGWVARIIPPKVMEKTIDGGLSLNAFVVHFASYQPAAIITVRVTLEKGGHTAVPASLACSCPGQVCRTR